MRRVLFLTISVSALVTAIVLLRPVTVSTQETTTSADKLIKFWAKNYPMLDEWKYSLNTFTYKVLAKAKPDECYFGLNYPVENRQGFDANYPNDLTKAQIKSCLGAGDRLKVNQSYIWGLTKSGNNLWFGTAANNVCRAPVSLFGGPMPGYETDSWVCHGGVGDARPPRMFVYDTSTNRLIDLTPKIVERNGDDYERLKHTVGIRSAGSFGNVVFFGGVSVANPQGEPLDIYTVVLFAFNADTKEYIDSYIYDGSDDSHPRYTNIRDWVVADDQMYVGVGTTVNVYAPATGKVLRWTGSVDDPFQFETVGNLDADPAYLVAYKHRLVSSTWGGDGLGGFVLYMSPQFGDDGMLTEADKSAWSIKWRISDYEPEPAAVQTGGAIAVEGDALIWGTLHATTTGWLAYQYMYRSAPTDNAAMLAAFFGTYRPISLFRAYNLEADDSEDRQVDLLYGSQYLPKFDPVNNEWNLVPNKMGGQMPLMGPIGMGNFFNTYTWWMENYRGKLFVGTFDYLYVAPRLALAVLFPGTTFPELPKEIVKLARNFEGADLWMFADDQTPAVPVTLSGAGNYTNYGIRTMITLNDTLYLGAANSMNLLTAGKYQGGFELIKVIPQNEP